MALSYSTYCLITRESCYRHLHLSISFSPSQFCCSVHLNSIGNFYVFSDTQSQMQAHLHNQNFKVQSDIPESTAKKTHIRLRNCVHAPIKTRFEFNLVCVSGNEDAGYSIVTTMLGKRKSRYSAKMLLCLHQDRATCTYVWVSFSSPEHRCQFVLLLFWPPCVECHISAPLALPTATFLRPTQDRSNVKLFVLLLLLGRYSPVMHVRLVPSAAIVAPAPH